MTDNLYRRLERSIQRMDRVGPMTDAELLELAKEAIASLQVHKGAHVLRRLPEDVLPDTDYGEPCQYCGMTWVDMSGYVLVGRSGCSYLPDVRKVYQA